MCGSDGGATERKGSGKQKERELTLVESEPLAETIVKLKQRRNVVILAHNYQLGEVQDVADFVSDWLELSQSAAETSARAIVFSGVRFIRDSLSALPRQDCSAARHKFRSSDGRYDCR